MNKGTKRLSWAKNLEMVVLLEKVYMSYNASTNKADTMMETKWASAFTFVKVARLFNKEFGRGLSYADYAYSAFCQIDTRFRMRTGYGDATNAKIRTAERVVSEWWNDNIDDHFVREVFIADDYIDWPDAEQRIFDADRLRRNTAASASNSKRRIAEENKVHPIVPLNRGSERVSLTCPLSNIAQVIKGLEKKYPNDPIVSLSLFV